MRFSVGAHLLQGPRRNGHGPQQVVKRIRGKTSVSDCQNRALLQTRKAVAKKAAAAKAEAAAEAERRAKAEERRLMRISCLAEVEYEARTTRSSSSVELGDKPLSGQLEEVACTSPSRRSP